MKVIIDILIMLGLVIGAWLGVRKGFIKSVSKLVRIIASVLLAYSLCGFFAEYVIDPIIFSSMKGQIASYLNAHYGDILTPENAGEKMPALFKLAASTIEGFSLEGVTQDDLIGSLVDQLASPTIMVISSIISFILLYLLFSIAIYIALEFADAVLSNGLFGLLNKILGGVCGFVIALGIVWLFCCVFGFLLPLIGGEEWISKFGEGGFIYSFLRGHGLLDLLLSF